MVKLSIFLLRIHQTLISPHLPITCRFYPSCTQYAEEALRRYGLLRGGLIALLRVLRCNPLFPGGYDPLR